jgi:hypothetical protein
MKCTHRILVGREIPQESGELERPGSGKHKMAKIWILAGMLLYSLH